MLSRFVRSLLSAASLSLLLAAPIAASAATPKDAGAESKDAAKKDGDKAKKGQDKSAKNDKGAKADKGDKGSKKDAAKADKSAKNDKGDKGDKGSKKDAAKADKSDKSDKSAGNDKGSKKDAAKADKSDKSAGNDKGDKGSKKDAAKADKKAHDKADKEDAKLVKADKKAHDKADKEDAKSDKAVSGTASIGAPNKGKLQGAVKLHSSRSLKMRERAQAWALPQLAKLLQRAAGKVTKHHARSVMLVGDLSQKTGGPLTGHNSHQSGRDADVGFYVANSKGQPAAMTRFVAFDGQGKSSQVSWAQFDDARNWSLVEALLTDKDVNVRYIFVSSPLRARVLAYASKKNVAKDLYTKAASALMAPRDADVHDDHFHIRIGCPDSMKGVCVEESSPKGTVLPVAPTSNAKADKGGDAKADKGDDAKADKADDAKAASDEPKSAPATDPKPAPATDAKTAP